MRVYVFAICPVNDEYTQFETTAKREKKLRHHVSQLRTLFSSLAHSVSVCNDWVYAHLFARFIARFLVTLPRIRMLRGKDKTNRYSTRHPKYKKVTSRNDKKKPAKMWASKSNGFGGHTQNVNHILTSVR